MTIRLGIIGLSEGNGHPYSWSAIINGYCPENMAQCEFPVIPRYLADQKWPDARITGAEVTHIWTQSNVLSTCVAKAALIPNIVAAPEAMLGCVDGILLARDDTENHYAFAKPFIEAGIPIYIDKPVALSLVNLNKLYSLQRYEGQIFTCSALRYARELELCSEARERIGEIRHVQATTPKSWAKYAVHIIEPVLRILGKEEILTTHSVPIATNGRLVIATFPNQTTAGFAAMGDNVAAPISIRVYGTLGWRDLVFSDSFSAFKCALQDFIDGIKTNSCRSPFEFNRQVVTIIEAGVAQ
jgi:predicted dehydrogenase